MLEDEPEKVPDTAALLLQLREALDAARSMPLSASVMLNRDEFGEILQDAIGEAGRVIVKPAMDALTAQVRDAVSSVSTEMVPAIAVAINGALDCIPVVAGSVLDQIDGLTVTTTITMTNVIHRGKPCQDKK